MGAPAYAEAAPHYRHAGWTGVLPVPADRKGPPPRGCTGGIGTDPDNDTIDMWRRIHPRHAVALRVPQDVIGLDVDAYKGGTDALTDWQHTHGTLPDTWRSSARSEGGIYFYRVPPRRKWAGKAGDGVDIVQWGHRYAVVAPSIHHTGNRYQWYEPSGLLANRVPDPHELPMLPLEWVVALDRGPR